MHKGMHKSKPKLAISIVSAALFLSSCADLVVTDVHYEQFTTQMLMVKATVKNQGSKAAPASSTRLEVTPPGAATRSAVAQTPALAPGQQVVLMISPLSPMELPRAPGQQLVLRACADSANVVSEGWSGEGNNCRTHRYTHP